MAHLVGYGHAPEHMSLYSAALGILISGDMVLPRISTNVSVVDVEPEGDPLTLYLDSVDRRRAFPPALVLPSHGLPFKGLHTRIDQLQAHHDERFAETLEACAEAPQSAVDLVPVLFKRKLDLHQMTFAMGESLAHLHALWFRGRLERVVGADGVDPLRDGLIRDRCQASRSDAGTALLARRARLFVVGHHRAHDVPEARAVVHLAQVRELVRDDVVDRRRADAGSGASAGGSSRWRWRCPSASPPTTATGA